MLEKILEVLEHLHLSHVYKSETARDRVSELLGELRASAERGAAQAIASAPSPPPPAPVEASPGPGAGEGQETEQPSAT